eukprot:Awhi_evm1s605
MLTSLNCNNMKEHLQLVKNSLLSFDAIQKCFRLPSKSGSDGEFIGKNVYVTNQAGDTDNNNFNKHVQQYDSNGTEDDVDDDDETDVMLVDINNELDQSTNSHTNDHSKSVSNMNKADVTTLVDIDGSDDNDETHYEKYMPKDDLRVTKTKLVDIDNDDDNNETEYVLIAIVYPKLKAVM